MSSLLTSTKINRVLTDCAKGLGLFECRFNLRLSSARAALLQPWSEPSEQAPDTITQN